MPVLTALSADEIRCLEDECPRFAETNLLTFAEDLRWSANGQADGADETDPTYPIAALYDGRLTTPTVPDTGSQTSWTITGLLPSGTNWEIDTAIVYVLGMSADLTLRLELSNVADFAALETVTFSPRSLQGSQTSGRVTWWGLNQGTSRFRATPTLASTPIYFRLILSYGTSATRPRVSEFFLGRMRLFSRPWNGSQAFDDRPAGSDYAEFDALNRDRVRYIQAAGFADFEASYDLIGSIDGEPSDRFGFDDLATLRALRRGTNYGASSAWYSRGNDPTRLMIFASDLNAPILAGDSIRRRWEVELLELPPFAEAEQSLFAEAEQSPSGWVDPTGLTWDYAWDFTDAPGGTADVPALVGGVALGRDAGSFSVASSYPSTVRSGQGYMAGTGLADTAASTEYSATLPGLSSTSDPVHVRLIARARSGSNWDITLGGGSSQSRIRLSESSTTDRWFVRVRDTGGSPLLQTELSAPIGDVVVFDVIVRNDGGGRLELWLNGQSIVVTTATTWAGPQTDDILVAVESMDVGWLGVRRAMLTQAAHDAAVNAVLTGVVRERYTFDEGWDFTDAPSTPGTVPAVAGGSSFDLALNAGNYAKGGLAGSVAALGSGMNDALVPGSGMELSATPAHGTSDPLHIRAVFEASVPTAGREYLLRYGTLVPGGGGDYIDVYTDSSSILRARWFRDRSVAVIAGVMVTAGELCVLDMWVGSDGSSGSQLNLTVNDQTATDTNTSVPYEGIDGDLIHMAHNSSTDHYEGNLVLLGIRKGAAANPDARVTEHDGWLLRAGT